MTQVDNFKNMNVSFAMMDSIWKGKTYANLTLY